MLGEGGAGPSEVPETSANTQALSGDPRRAAGLGSKHCDPGKGGAETVLRWEEVMVSNVESQTSRGGLEKEFRQNWSLDEE